MSELNNGSGSAINELSRSKSRYQHQDLLLKGFMHMPESTAKEVAAEYHDWVRERYADAPKRAADLASTKLGYLEQCGNRQCRQSGKNAHTYKITERGIAHLRKVGLLSSVMVSALLVKRTSNLPAAMPIVARAGFAEMAKQLRDDSK